MPKKQLPPDVLAFFKKTGSKGGKKRARTYTKEQLSEWGKRGGRPKGRGKNKSKKATKEGGKLMAVYKPKRKGEASKFYICEFVYQGKRFKPPDL
jgi:hypothetical protein